MDFILGCNYWASNAGIEMWKNFDAEAIKKDLKILSDHGIEYLRVFPLWRDFQPVKANLGIVGSTADYVLESSVRCENENFLDEDKLSQFEQFLDICDSYNIKLIVGLITGWMSGGFFIPSALQGKNVITDSVAIYFEHLFIKGFVEKFKNRKAIYAWDLGNECNCSGEVKNRFEAAAWTATISNGIHTADPERPVVSGMHSLTLEDNWRIQDQARFTDILTTHPYPLWCTHTTIDDLLSYRTTTHATAETKWYSDIGNKPCLAEEIGTMGPMVCSNEKAADFLRLNLFSLWANGSTGVMWWCNSDQNTLTTYPYTVNMIEQELGLVDSNHNPKPAILEYKKFSQFLKENNISLPKAKEDAVCLLTRDQDHWGVAYMTYALAKSVNLNLKFSYAYEQELPPSQLYIMPSVSGMAIMPKDKYEALKQKVADGADLYISAGKVFLQGFEDFIGIKVVDSAMREVSRTVKIGDDEITTTSVTARKYAVTTAEVLLTDLEGNPFITVNNYGKGRVFFVDAPIEHNLIHTQDAFDSKIEKIYKEVFKEHIQALPVILDSEKVVFTYHPDENGGYVVAINHSDTERKLNFKFNKGQKISEVVYGSSETIKPFDASVIRIENV